MNHKKRKSSLDNFRPKASTNPLMMKLHGLVDEIADINLFARLLEGGMEHYPDQFGFLFKRNGKGERVIAQAIATYGKEETIQTIHNIIPSIEDYPTFLHHVFQYTPELGEDFLDRYPKAIHLKDEQGRLLLHVAIDNGMKLSDSLLTKICSEKCIEEKDPVTNLYPFMFAAASGRKNKDPDLTMIYKLLISFPEVISG